MAYKPPSIPISQSDFLIAQHEWVVQINNTRVTVRECKRCFSLYDVKNTRHNCPCFSCVVCLLVFPLGWVLHCHCTITRAKFNISLTCAGSVRTPPCRIVRETLLHSSLQDHFNNSFVNFSTNVFSKITFAKNKKKVSLQYLQFSSNFRLKIDACFLIATDLMHQFGCFSIPFQTYNIFPIFSKLVPIYTYSCRIFLAVLSISKSLLSVYAYQQRFLPIVGTALFHSSLCTDVYLNKSKTNKKK